jgi:hypothetical protein
MYPHCRACLFRHLEDFVREASEKRLYCLQRTEPAPGHPFFWVWFSDTLGEMASEDETYRMSVAPDGYDSQARLESGHAFERDAEARLSELRTHTRITSAELESARISAQKPAPGQ